MYFNSILPLPQLLLTPPHYPPYPTLCSFSLSQKISKNIKERNLVRQKKITKCAQKPWSLLNKKERKQKGPDSV